MAGTTHMHVGVLEFQLPCELDQVRQAGDRVRVFLSGQGCTIEQARDCELAVIEACNNAVQNARPAARRLPVRVQVTCNPREIELRVTDHTPGFNWPAKAILPRREAENGRGVFLIQALMDSSEYVRCQNRNTLVLQKRRDASA
jgi:anti-sigma regulatory factor (Ser/Thr protein kinase)